MRTVEVEGNSRVDATRRALELLGADVDDVKVEVIREEPRGILGFLGFKRVTVRVTLVEENVLEDAAEIINRIVSFLPVPVEARVEMHKHGVHIELAGHELRQFQKEDDVADALAHVLELIINRRAKNKIAVKATFAEDKLSREEELRRLARVTADRVVLHRKEEPLAPMTPRDRRTVHMTLERDDRVVTESAGNGNKRHVVVHPAAARRKRPPEAAAKPKAKGERRARPPSKPRAQKSEPEKAGAPPSKSPRRRRRRKPRGGDPDKKQSPS
jgi:spoIIIJ-associated protein